jgi:hypothetical protein
MIANTFIRYLLGVNEYTLLIGFNSNSGYGTDQLQGFDLTCLFAQAYRNKEHPQAISKYQKIDGRGM